MRIALLPTHHASPAPMCTRTAQPRPRCQERPPAGVLSSLPPLCSPTDRLATSIAEVKVREQRRITWALRLEGAEPLTGALTGALRLTSAGLRILLDRKQRQDRPCHQIAEASKKRY